MSGPSVKAYLEDLCRGLDELTAAPGLRRAAATLAIPAAALLACAPEPIALYGVPAYGVPYEDEICDDGIDNDYDDLADCEDPFCDGLELCVGCDDGYDNDGDGVSDCSDASCAGAEACVGGCDDGSDDDGDGLTDCADPDCGGSPPCAPTG
jgi:hypothetical protein